VFKCAEYFTLYSLSTLYLFAHTLHVLNNVFVCSYLLGIFTAAHDLKSEWVVVKGVSCFADSSANKLWETFASVMAASLVSNILSDPFVFEQWPHHGGMHSSLY